MLLGSFKVGKDSWFLNFWFFGHYHWVFAICNFSFSGSVCKLGQCVTFLIYCVCCPNVMAWTWPTFEHCLTCPSMASLDDKLLGVMCKECFGLSIDLFTLINVGQHVYSGRGPCSILPSVLTNFANCDNLHAYWAIFFFFCVSKMSQWYLVFFRYICMVFIVN